MSAPVKRYDVEDWECASGAFVLYIDYEQVVRERDALRKLIDEAPHGKKCASKGPCAAVFPGPRCDCWKSRGRKE